MSDSLIAKLQRMADRGTPPEAAVAQAKLAAMGAGVPPRRPPAPAAAPAPDPGDDIGGWFEEGMRQWRMQHRNSAAAWTTASTATSTWANIEFSGGRT